MSFLSFLAARRAELLALAAQHLVLVAAATAAAVAIGLPLGIAMTRLRRLARPLLALAGVVQTIPSLALFGFLIPLPLLGGIGTRTALTALILYALLPILQNTYAGIQQVDPTVLESATAIGMTPGQRLRLVELPLALPVILAGVRIAAVVSVGTATIAAAIGAGGLGTYVFRGIATVDSRLILAGAVPAALMALAVDALLGAVEKSRRPLHAAAALSTGLVITLGIALAVARPGRERPVVVGSKNFTEQVVLGEMVAGLLEARGFPVERKLNLGGTNLCHQGLLSGELDVYVEYSGTALADILAQPVPPDAAQVLPEVRRRYAALGLDVLPPLGFDNTYALVVRGDDARRLPLVHISDLAPHAARLRVGLFGEFLERPDGMKGLTSTYGLHFGPAPREMDLGLLYTALLGRQVDLVVGSATDGLIAARDLVVLEDDRHYFPPYDAVPVTSRRAAERHPALRAALAALSGRVDAAAMRRMNYAVDGEHKDPKAVARDFLREAKLTN